MSASWIRTPWVSTARALKHEPSSDLRHFPLRCRKPRPSGEGLTRKNGNSAELNKKVVSLRRDDDGPDHGGLPRPDAVFRISCFAVFLVSEIDQLTCVPYIDAVESFGLPADCLPGALLRVRCSGAGCAATTWATCFISSSMPCDGSTMASSYMCPPLPGHTRCSTSASPSATRTRPSCSRAAEDIKACIKFIEEQTGAKWSWDAYFTAMKRFNTETSYELEEVGGQPDRRIRRSSARATSCSASGTTRWTAASIPRILKTCQEGQQDHAQGLRAQAKRRGPAR